MACYIVIDESAATRQRAPIDDT